MFADSVAEQAQTERDKTETAEPVGQFSVNFKNKRFNFRNFFE